MRLLDALVRTERPDAVPEQRSWPDFARMVFDGSRYIIGPDGSKPDEIDGRFKSYIDQIHNRHGVVAAAVVTRALLMSQVRFKFRRPDGTLYGSPALRPLERPGSRTRPSLLAALEIDASYSGTAVGVVRRGRVYRLPPDKVKFVLGSNSDPSWDGDVMVPPFDTEIVSVVYDPSYNSPNPGAGQMEAFMPGEFFVWSPEPDPVHFWRGSSWVTSVVREVLLDGQVTDHSGKFFENAGTPSIVFIMDRDKTPDEVKAYKDVVDRAHVGTRNAWKNMFLGGATDAKVVGTSIKDIGLDSLQGTFENRVAVRSRIPASVLGTKESLSGSSLNAGNYSAARRLLADGWFTPAVDGLCAALESIIPVPDDGSELAHDPDRILFLQEDRKDAADIMQTHAVAARQLVEAGYEPSSVMAALISGDLSKLTHTGNVSVQLQPVGSNGGSDV